MCSSDLGTDVDDEGIRGGGDGRQRATEALIDGLPDEVLDYREAVRYYAGAEQVVVEGGDHTLQSFEQHLPGIVAFARLV